MGSMSIMHWVIVLAIVVLIFGTKKLRNLGGDLGGAIKNFKSAMSEGEQDANKQLSKPAENTDSADKKPDPH